MALVLNRRTRIVEGLHIVPGIVASWGAAVRTAPRSGQFLLELPANSAYHKMALESI
jgi:hypothetical protein